MNKIILAMLLACGLLFAVPAPSQSVSIQAVEAAKFCWPGGGNCRVVHHSTPDPGVDTGLQVKCKVEANFDYDEISTIPEGGHSDSACHNLYSGPVAIRNPVGHPVKCIVNTVTLWGHVDGSWWNLGGAAPNNGWWCEVV